MGVVLATEDEEGSMLMQLMVLNYMVRGLEGMRFEEPGVGMDGGGVGIVAVVGIVDTFGFAIVVVALVAVDGRGMKAGSWL